MSWFVDDPDTYEQVCDSRPCTACQGGSCTGMCNGSFSVGRRQRSAEEIAAIRAERLRREEDDVLTRAAEITARRAAMTAGSPDATR